MLRSRLIEIPECFYRHAAPLGLRFLLLKIFSRKLSLCAKLTRK